MASPAECSFSAGAMDAADPGAARETPGPVVVAATTRLIDRLEERGLVDRRACGTDRRGMFVGLTPCGEKTSRDAGRVHLRGIDAHAGTQLSPGELAELRHLLNRLASGVDGNELALLEGSHS